MSELDALYPEIIADHVKHPRRRGLLPEATAQSRQLNPTCGDEVTLQLVLDGDRIVDAAWTGHGCMISQSSASILAEQAPGLTVAELEARIASFRARCARGASCRSTRSCSATRSPSRAPPASWRASSARCWPGWRRRRRSRPAERAGLP